MTSESRYLREGIIAGLIGAAIVAVWFLIYDAAQGRPFRTPALLGAATFQGVANPAAVPVTTELVVQYTVLHGVVFAMIGVLIAYLIVSSQREPSRLLDHVHRAHVLRGLLPRGARLARASRARRGGLVEHPRRQCPGGARHARVLLRGPSRPRPRAARPVDARGPRGRARRAGGRRRRRGVVPALRSRRRRAAPHAGAPRRRRSSTACAIRARS